MAITPAGFWFRKTLQELLEERSAGNTFDASRRTFIKNTAFVAAGALLSNKLFAAGNTTKPTVSIIGGGGAGLMAAYVLQQHNIPFTLYEASERYGGRMYSVKNWIDTNVATDLGGEFVDEEHEELIGLCKELDIELYDLRNDNLFYEKFFAVDGKRYTSPDLRDALQPFAGAISADIASLPESLTYKNGDVFKQFDEITIIQYLDKLGMTGWIRKLVDVIYTAEYGMESSEQTAMNFLITIKPPVKNETGVYRIYGDDHEIYKIKGGSQTVPDKLYEKVSASVKLKHELITYNKTANDQYELTIKTGDKNIRATFDYIILCIPFTVLRTIQTNVVYPAIKQKAINELGYGNSSKFILGFNAKPWRDHKESGTLFSDVVAHNIWDNSFAQQNTKGGLTFFSGGNLSHAICQKDKEVLKDEMLAYAAKEFHIQQKHFDGKYKKICWELNPFTKGGYSSYTINQWSTFGGVEAEPFENIFFAGEHTSLDYQGFMNGAIATGKQAALNIAERINDKAFVEPKRTLAL
ncbi:MAG TPA: NAD(P)/FAD-dependent oxidoreductase [Parafilimonas sp.]|nr:NAD(P)/FAD-dependent oxidoreductase [Parafilimonas sp.]